MVGLGKRWCSAYPSRYPRNLSTTPLCGNVTHKNPLRLGIWTPTLPGGPSSWADGLTHFGVASRFGVMDLRALPWPLKFG